VVGTQINGAPHIGTSLVQSLTFAAADRVRERFGRPVEVVFSALDNAPYEIVTDPVTGHRYQRAYAQALGAQAINEQIATLYEPLFAALSDRLAVPYRIETYSAQQATEHYRRTWLRVLPRVAAARWWLAPSSGKPHVRVPCLHPNCGLPHTGASPGWEIISTTWHVGVPIRLAPAAGRRKTRPLRRAEGARALVGATCVTP
jgi:hypothetical protein